mgnify:FL=1|tara:strand:- start:9459 stop:10445 length:987 start_codon:yes stop_codon:yes gene_type:complete
MLISRTPYRLSLYGGGLDYPAWYKKKETQILCAGLDYYCYQTVRELPPFFEHRYRVAYSKIESVKEVDQINHPTAREVIRKFGQGKNLEITHVGDLPSRSGIGSSSAFTVGLITSLSALVKSEFLGRTKLARLAIDIEQNDIGETIGVQDQCASAFGGLVHITADKEGIKPKRFLIRKEYQKYIESSLLMGFTGRSRFSSVASKKVDVALKTDGNIKKLEELHEISQKGIEAFGNEADIQENAFLTRECRNIKLALNQDYGDPMLMELIEESEKAGSLCTRIMGAGGGGFFLCWAPEYKHEAIKSKINVKTWVKVKISSTGSQVIFSE